MADHFTELAESFVLKILDDREARQFAQHLAAGCEECRHAVDEARKVASLLPYLAPQSEPPPELKQRLLDAVAAEAPAGIVEKREAVPFRSATIRSMPQRTFFQRVQGSLAWAAVFLLVAVGYGYIVQRNLIVQLRQQLAVQEQQLNERRAEIKLLQFERERQETVIQQIQNSKAPHLLLVNLQGTDADAKPPGGVKVLLDPQTSGGSFIAYDLPRLSDEHDYQLWFIKDGKPVGAGVFQVNEKGEFIGAVEHLPATLAGVAAFAVTREPKGGRPTPTMPIYWAGNMQGV
jgi:anti-sigma-K factor RskA